jgi:hypothetical protein
MGHSRVLAYAITTDSSHQSHLSCISAHRNLSFSMPPYRRELSILHIDKQTDPCDVHYRIPQPVIRAPACCVARCCSSFCRHRSRMDRSRLLHSRAPPDQTTCGRSTALETIGGCALLCYRNLRTLPFPVSPQVGYGNC